MYNFNFKSNGWLNRLFAFILITSLVLSTMASTPYSPTAQEGEPTTDSSGEALQETPAPTEAQLSPTAGDPQVSQQADSETEKRVNFRQIVVHFGGITAPQTQGVTGSEIDTLESLAPNAQVRAMGKQVETAALEGSSAVASSEPLSNYYVVELGADKTYADALQVVANIKGLAGVDQVYMEPIYVTASTPNHQADQKYLGVSASNGIYATATDSVWTKTGGEGADVRIIDVEYGWQIPHEDLAITNSSLISSTNSSDQEQVRHGTAVLGIMSALHNTIGMRGIASDAEIRLVSPNGRTLAEAIKLAKENARAGDIIVIPLQAMDPITRNHDGDDPVYTPCKQLGGDYDCSQIDFLPVEYWDANYNAIKSATNAGIIVVEAAGNGLADLDNTDFYGDKFQRSYRDSNAILVGAGDSGDAAAAAGDHPQRKKRERSYTSNFGTRLDIQGWGDSIATTGGNNDLVDAAKTDTYTVSFGGTSGAAAMVAGAAASLQGIAKNLGYVISPADMRSFLVSTGTAQLGNTAEQKVGPLPNLKKALDEKVKSEIVLLTPVDISVDPGPLDTLRPTLDWTDHLGATKYHVQVGTGSTFTTKVVDISTLTTSSYTIPTNLGSNRVYYWRVKGYIKGAWSDWTSSWSFKTPATSSIPGVPTSLSPTNSSVISPYTPTFKWKAPSTAPGQGYRIQITLTPTVGSGTIADIPAGTLKYKSATLMGDKLYYWRVQSKSGGVYSAWTNWFVLYTTPRLLTGLTAPVESLRPELSWNAIQTARKYQVNIYRRSGTNLILVQTYTLKVPEGQSTPNPYITLTHDLARSSSFKWGVKVLGKYGWSNFAWKNLVTYAVPYAPSLSSPTTNSLYAYTALRPTFKWTLPYSSTYHASEYEIQISTSSEFEDNDPGKGIHTIKTTIPGPNPHKYYRPGPGNALLANRQYYWRVRAMLKHVPNSGDYQYSNFSTVRVIKTAPPPPTNLISPINSKVVSSLRPTLTWNIVDTAKAYRVVFSTDPAFPSSKIFLIFTATKNISTDPTKMSVEVPSTLSKGKKIYWKVASIGTYGYGYYSTFNSTVHVFRTCRPPTNVALSSPSNNSTIGSFNPTLDWTDSVDDKTDGNDLPIKYYVEIATESDFNNDSIVLKKSALTSSQYTISGEELPSAGKYYWRVRSRNNRWYYSAWSSVSTFTTPPMLKGRVFQALPDNPNLVIPADTKYLEGVKVCISGSTLCATTEKDADGVAWFKFRSIPTGTVTLNTSYYGYMRDTGKATLSNGINSLVDFSLVNTPPEGTIRIVLNWNDTPTDLDAHLWLPASKSTHVYYNRSAPATNVGSSTADPFAELMKVYTVPPVDNPPDPPVLARNIDTGYGPEIIDVLNAVETNDGDADLDKMYSGTYLFAVRDYGSSTNTKLITSGATVTIYDGSTFVKTYTIPTGGTGRWWKVFKLDGDTRVITLINTITDTDPVALP